jgi:hypothetical protein
VLIFLVKVCALSDFQDTKTTNTAQKNLHQLRQYTEEGQMRDNPANPSYAKGSLSEEHGFYESHKRK